MSGPQPVALRDAIIVLGSALEEFDGLVPATELARRRDDAGISPRTMTRARAALGTAAVRRGRAWYIIRPWPTREVH
jgi:hypothetical protein